MRIFDFGPRAGDIPGPEDLDNFDPTEHLIIEGKAIAEVPGHPGTLLRWHPKDPKMLGLVPANEESIENHIVRAQQHMQAICIASGNILQVPSHRSFIAPNPLDTGKLAIVTLVERIEGTSYGYCAQASETATAVYGLAKYLQWVIATQQPEILSDTFNSKQLVTQSVGTKSQNYVVDIDAILSSTPKNPRHMQWYVDRLWKWRQMMPDVPYAVAADVVLRRVEDAIHRLEPSEYAIDQQACGDGMVPAIQRIISTMSPDEAQQ